MNPQEIVERANQAQRVLDDPTLKKAFDGVREALVARLEASAIGDESTHHTIALCLQNLKEVQRMLARWIMDGQVEAKRAEKGNY